MDALFIVAIGLLVPLIGTGLVAAAFKMQAWGKGEATNVLMDEVPAERRLGALSNEGSAVSISGRIDERS